MELAAAGTDRTVSQYTSDVNYASPDAVDNDQSLYVAMATQLQDTPFLLFAFGKAVGSKLGRSKFVIKGKTDNVQKRNMTNKAIVDYTSPALRTAITHSRR